MFQNYLLTSFRSLLRQKLFTLINVIGLAIGLTACTLIILFVEHEFSYDNQFADLDRLYRIEATANIPGQQSTENPQFFGPTYDLLPADFEEIETIVRLQQRGGTVIKGDSSIPETFATVDPEFLTIFDFPMVEGDRETALAEPSSIVLTEEMALKHLGPAPWLGKTLEINETLEREMKVTAVIETLPGNTHFDIDMLVPMDKRVYDAGAAAFGGSALERWNGLPFNVYVKLKSGRSPDNLRSGLNDWVDRNFPARLQALVGIKGSELFTPRLMPVRDIHMFSPVQFDMRTPGSLEVIYSFSGIALLILAIASINFMNLSTATSTLRAKEVAMRKVMGANRRQLFLQFETESVMLAIIGLFLALVAIEIILPTFSNYTEREMTTASLLNPVVSAAIVGLTLFIGLIAGLHPALVISGFRPAHVLKSNRSGVSGSTTLRALLVLFQFAISAALIILTLLMYVQTDYARSMNMGYANEDKLTIRGLFEQQIGNRAESVRDEIARVPGVSDVSLASFTPGDGRNVGLSLQVPGQSERVIIFYRAVYPNFFRQFGVEPIAGRLLDDNHPGDRSTFNADPNNLEPQSVNVVLNVAATKTMGFATPEDAIGQIYYRGQENQIVSTIVGVIPDVNFGSPRADFDGEIYMYIPAQVGNLLVTYEGDEFSEVRDAIEAKLKDLLPRAQTQVMHLEENIAQQYREEEIQGALLAIFSGLAVLIACMGLFGLASFTIARRTKEIGIRKVMGASSLQIVTLLLKQFSAPVLIANIIAWPVCWYVMSAWLTEFNFQIALLPWFALAVTVAVLMTTLLAWGTVAGHAVRVARTNPVFALRYE